MVCSGSILELEVVKVGTTFMMTRRVHIHLQAVHSNAGITIMWWHPGESILYANSRSLHHFGMEEKLTVSIEMTDVVDKILGISTTW